MFVRLLTGEDAAHYQPIWLRALQDHPEAFGRDYYDERHTTIEQVAAGLNVDPADKAVFGLFEENTLSGIATLHRYPGRKTRHRAIVGSMYVIPEARGQGGGRALMRAILDHARSQRGLERLIIAVTVGNEAARQLYLSAGFVPTFVEEGYIKWEGRYYDIEWMRMDL
ncbi:MAG: GNAT family N-acetyltransferase [Caldilineaceae bacterium]|nr:GNAT family N-acetyltransferase [Caldilineaceae bacterium]